jgi:hypothetical protein
MTWTIGKFSSYPFVLILFMCLGILFQILGVPVTFGDLSGSDDDFISNVLMGLSVLSGNNDHAPLHSFLSLAVISSLSYFFLHEHIFLHPPPI